MASVAGLIAVAAADERVIAHPAQHAGITTGSTPCERQVRGRLFAFYDWCAQNEQVTELTTLAATICRWEGEIVAAVITGVTNARSESLNRIAKLEARHAYGFRSPASQRRRVRIACTRRARRKEP